MQSSASGLFVLLAFAVMIPAMYLLVSGLRGRRVGDEPRCARCGYILLHLESDVCPECGTAISPANTVHGQKRRGIGRSVLGLVLLTVAVLMVLAPVRSAIGNIPWYQYKPARFVLADLDVPAIYQKAMAELSRREAAGGLPEWVHAKLIEMALAEQAGTGATRQELLDYFGKAILDGRATQAQLDCFLDQACKLTMEVRAVVGEGDQIPFSVWRNGRGPGGKYPVVFWYSDREMKRSIDGKAVRLGSGGSSGGLTGLTGSHSTEPAGPVGRHVLAIENEFAIWHGQMSKESASRLIGKRTVTAEATYEVVPKEQTPPIELLDSEELRKQVAAAIRVTRFSQQKNGYLNANFELMKLPCDVAFDVFVVVDGKEKRIGSISAAKGKSTHYGTGGMEGVGGLQKVNVILRASVEAAKRTVDLTAIFSGEIVFEDVVVEAD